MVKWIRCKLVEWWRSNETASPTRRWGTVLHQTGNCHQYQDNTQTTIQSTGWKMVSNPDFVQYCITEGKGLDIFCPVIIVLTFHATTTVSICFVLKASAWLFCKCYQQSDISFRSQAVGLVKYDKSCLHLCRLQWRTAMSFTREVDEVNLFKNWKWITSHLTIAWQKISKR